MILAGPRTKLIPHPEAIRPFAVRPAYRVDTEVDPMEESRARLVERIESAARRAHAWAWGEDADTRSRTFGYSLIAVLFCVVLVAALR